MKFWDSSAIVPLLLREASTRRLQTHQAQDQAMLAWWGSSVECTAAIARREREGTLNTEMVNLALQRLDIFAENWVEVQPGEGVRNVARRLLRVYSLRASDALQLAAALVGIDRDSPITEIVCLDRRLALAAQKEGLRVLS